MAPAERDETSESEIRKHSTRVEPEQEAPILIKTNMYKAYGRMLNSSTDTG